MATQNLIVIIEIVVVSGEAELCKTDVVTAATPRTHVVFVAL